MGDLKSLGDVIPDFDGLISGAGNDKLFPNTDIETGDLLGVVAAVDEVEFWLSIGSIVEWDVYLEELVAPGDEVDVFLGVRHGHRGDLVVHFASKWVIF